MKGAAIERWCQLLWCAVLTTVSLWCTYQTLTPTLRIWWPKQEKVQSPRRMNRFNEKNPEYVRTMILSSLTSSLFSTAQLVYLSAYLIFMNEVGWFSKTAGSADEWTAFWVVNDLYIASLFFQFLGYAGLLSTMFIRVTSVFNNTKYMINDSVIRWFYVTLVLCVLFISVLFYVALEISFMGYYLVFVPAVTYIVLSLLVCHKFYSSMSDLIFHNHKYSGDWRFSLSMMDITLRVTLLNMVSIVSTSVLFLITFVSVPISYFMYNGRVSGARCLNLSWEIMAWLNTLDTTLGKLTLMCTLKFSTDCYYFLFGCIHEFWKKRLIQAAGMDLNGVAQPELVPNNSDTLENDDLNVRATEEPSHLDAGNGSMEDSSGSTSHPL